MSDKVFLGQVAIGDYRARFMELISEEFGDRLSIYCGRSYFYESLKTCIPESVHVTWVQNQFLLGRRAVFQRSFIAPALRASVAVLELNPRILNVWIVLIVRRLMKRPTVLWGHAWPRAGSASGTDRIRGWMRRLASILLVYTDGQKRELESEFPKLRIIAAPNAIYSEKVMREVVAGSRDGLLYVGRLVADKKVDLAIRAIAVLRAKGRVVPNLMVVGDGPQRSSLETLVRSLGVDHYVSFLGHVSDPAKLRPLYENALATLSTGYAGLSLTQSFGFGVPVIIGDNEPHAPEIEAAVEGFNCEFFHADSVDSLACVIEQMWSQRLDWIARAAEISTDCRRKYSAEAMAARFAQAVSEAGQ